MLVCVEICSAQWRHYSNVTIHTPFHCEFEFDSGIMHSIVAQICISNIENYCIHFASAAEMAKSFLTENSIQTKPYHHIFDSQLNCLMEINRHCVSLCEYAVCVIHKHMRGSGVAFSRRQALFSIHERACMLL